MTLPEEAIEPIKDWVAKNPGKICKGAEYIALLAAMKETGYFDKKTEAQLKNTLHDQLGKIRERIIRPQKHGDKPKRLIGELSSQGPDASRKRSKAWHELNPEYMPTWREKNADKIEAYWEMRRQLAAAQNAARNAELTDLMHAGSAGTEFRPYKAPEVLRRMKQILQKKRPIFDGKTLAEAIESEKFALYFFSTRTRVVESDMKNVIPTAPGGYGEAGRFLAARGSMQQLTRASSKAMRRRIARSGKLYYVQRQILKRVDPDDPDNPDADITITYKFLREKLRARIAILHLARVRYQVDQIEGALQDHLQHELKCDYPYRLHRHKIGPKSDGDAEMIENYMAKCGVTALKIDSVEGKNILWVNGIKLRIYR